MANANELKRKIDMHVLADKLGIKRGKGDGANYHSPLSKDEKPSLSIFERDGVFMFKDHSSGKAGSCIDLVCLVNDCEVGDAMRWLHEAFGIPFDTPNSPNAPRRQKSVVDYIAERAVQHAAGCRDYLTGRGISEAVIDRAIKCRTLGMNNWTSESKKEGELGYGGDGVCFLIYDANGMPIGADTRYFDPEKNGGTKTNSQGTKSACWTSDPRRLKSAHAVFIVESSINALSIDTADIPYTAAVAIRGIANIESIDWSFLHGKQVYLCLDNDDVIEEGPRKGERPGPDAEAKLYELITAMNIGAICVDKSGWRYDRADECDEKLVGKSINDVNDYLCARDPDTLKRALQNLETCIIPGMYTDKARRKGKMRVYLPEHDFAQYWRYYTRPDFMHVITKRGVSAEEAEEDGGEEKAPEFADLATFRVASFSRVTIAGYSATTSGAADNDPSTQFAVSVQTARNGARLTRAVLNDHEVHNAASWNQFGTVFDPKAFARMVNILERTSSLGARNAVNYVGLCWKDQRLTVNEGTDCYFVDPAQQCTYSGLTFNNGPESDAAPIIAAYQATMHKNAAMIPLAWALGAHLKCIFGFWPHFTMQAGKNAGKSTLIKAMERTIGFKMLSGQSLQTEFRLMTASSYTSHPVGFEELSARGQQIIDKAVSILQESYNYSPTKRGAQMLEFVLCAPIMLAGEDVPVKSILGKLVRCDLTNKKGTPIDPNMPVFPVKQWLQYLATLDADVIRSKLARNEKNMRGKLSESTEGGGNRIVQNYAAIATAWSLLCDFAGIDKDQGGFPQDLLDEMNRHLRETVSDRSPWTWIMESSLAAIDARSFNYPHLFDTIDGVECLVVRPAHIMEYMSVTPALRGKFDALPVKTAGVFEKQLEEAGVVFKSGVERVIMNRRIQRMSAISLSKLAEFGLTVAVDLNHQRENA
jgi:hypothetical protein